MTNEVLILKHQKNYMTSMPYEQKSVSAVIQIDNLLQSIWEELLIADLKMN